MSPARFASTYVFVRASPLPLSHSYFVVHLTYPVASESRHLSSLIDAGASRPPGAADLLGVPSLLLLVKALVPAEPLEWRVVAVVCKWGLLSRQQHKPGVACLPPRAVLSH